MRTILSYGSLSLLVLMLSATLIQAMGICVEEIEYENMRMIRQSDEQEQLLKKLIADPCAELNKLYQLRETRESYPIEIACKKDSFTKYLKILLQRGAQINACPINANLFQACAYFNTLTDNIKLIYQYALRQDVSIPSLLAAHNQFEGTPLHSAANWQGRSIFLYLLEIGAPINNVSRFLTPIETFFSRDPRNSHIASSVIKEILQASDKAGITNKNLMKLKELFQVRRRFKDGAEYEIMVDKILQDRLNRVATLLREMHATNTCWVNRVPRELVSLLVPFALDASVTITNQFMSAPAQQSNILLLPHFEPTEGLHLQASK